MLFTITVHDYVRIQYLGPLEVTTIRATFEVWFCVRKSFSLSATMSMSSWAFAKCCVRLLGKGACRLQHLRRGFHMQV